MTVGTALVVCSAVEPRPPCIIKTRRPTGGFLRTMLMYKTNAL